MPVVTSGVLFSHIQAIVPMIYKYGVSASTYFSSSYKLHDGLENTNYSLPSNNATGHILNTTISGNMYLYIHGYSGVITGTGQKFYIKNGSIAGDNYNIIGSDILRGGVAEWAYDSASDYFSLTVAPDGREDIYVNFSGIGSTYTMVASGTTDNNMINIMFSKDYKLRMFDEDYQVDFTWESPGVELDGKDGYYTLAKDRKWTKRMKFKWTELDTETFGLFEDFFDAFGGNLSQPFAFLLIHNDNIGGFSPILGVLDGNSIEITYTGDGTIDYWNVGFSIYVLDEEMNIDVGPWY